ncbi:MAG: ribonuclease H-like domain-containing protein [Deltaproteobacteria bacterium]|nr:ribonuclease H-like domain-containing protein [Deltaproteobacteria bacterium]
MLRNTFIHLPGVGPKTERSLWDIGYIEWQDVANRPRPRTWGAARWDDLKARVGESEAALLARDAQYFERRLHASETWRIYRFFSDKAAFVDIETTGLSGPDAQITVVGVYDGNDVHQFVEGIDLEKFQEFIEPFELLVTYNGKCFDIPILRNRFRRAHLERKGHIDLRYVFAAQGFSGGLKGIEKRLGIARPGEVAQMDGYAAVICWFRYCQGQTEYLDLLRQYNAEDTRNLKPLAETACVMARQKLVTGTPLMEGANSDGG